MARAAASVTTGQMIRLDLPLDVPDPPLFGRRAVQHHVVALNRHEMDDALDDFHPQGSTQWDALGHVRCREHGYWGGRTQDPTEGPNGLGIEHWAEHGIAGRGVLIDVAGWLRRRDRGYDPLSPLAITADDVRAVLAAQGVEPEVGDIWCVRTGWVRATAGSTTRPAGRTRPTPHVRRAVRRRGDGPDDLERPPGRPVLRQPGRRGRPRRSRRRVAAPPPAADARAPRSVRCSTSSELAAACRADGRWTFFFVAVPLNLPGGIGSPGNAVAIR